MMQRSAMSAELRYEKVVRALSRDPRVTVGSEKKGFGASALKVKGKIFAMPASKGEFVVKLPRERVDELVASKMGKRFDLGHGRVMKEWFAVDPSFQQNWLALAKEALRFVASKA
jgi:hypothetical protein